MAIFDKNVAESNRTTGATIIAECTSIKGEINTECSVHIDGKFEGTIHSTSLVLIGKKGTIIGEVFAKGFIVSGLFEGTTDCDKIEILDGGCVRGKAISHQLVIEKNGFLEGESRRRVDAKKKNEKIEIS
jgi:cytoskeletal protein CcmA (bactofilin family)